MPNYFYIDTNGQKQGLINDQQLQALAARGIIVPTTPMITDTGHKGFAGQIPGLKFNIESKPNKTLAKTSEHKKWILRGIYLTSAVIVLIAFGVLASIIGSRTSNDGRFEADNLHEAFNVEEQADVDTEGENGNAPLHEAEEIEVAESAPPPFVEFKEKYLSSAFFSPDGKYIVLNGSSTWLWDVESRRPHHALGYATCFIFSPDGKRIVVGNSDGTAQILDAESGKELRKLGQKQARTDYEIKRGLPSRTALFPSAFSPNGRIIITTSRQDKTIRLWDVVSGVELQRLVGHPFPVNYVAFSPDGSKIVSFSNNDYRNRGTVRIWYLDPVGNWRTLAAWNTSFVEHVATSPDGNKIVAFSNDYVKSIGTIRVWYADPVLEWQTLEWHTDNIALVAFLPDGKKIVTYNRNVREAQHYGTVRIWDTEPERVLQTPELHIGIVRSVAFLPNGKKIVSLSDKTVLIGDAEPEMELQTLQWHIAPSYGASFSPDGSKFVTINPMDHTFRIWDTESGKVLRKWRGNVGSIRTNFSPNGKKIVTASDDHTARIWTLE